MMQFTETATNVPFSNNNNPYYKMPRPWPPSGNTTFSASATKALSSTTFGDANCMEQLLVHCATAIETSDSTLAQQLLWVLNNIAIPDGDSNQRLTCGFLRALILRAVKTGTCKMLSLNADAYIATHKFSVIELASFVDLTPWHRFGFTAANAAILDAVDGYSIVHIVDLSLTHCMQIPTLIDAIATRFENPPLVKLTVAGSTEDIPPMLDLSYEELGSKLINFSRSRNVLMEFRVLPSSSTDGFSSFINQIAHLKNDSEALIVNCHMMLHYIPEETTTFSSFHSSPTSSLRSLFLKAIRNLEPNMVLVIDEDADFTSNNLVTRLRSAFNYLWIPYDTVDTFLPRGSKQRQWYEADICWKIESVIAHEGVQRVERLEPKSRWVQRMRNANFKGVMFGDEAMLEVKAMLDEHAAGWGLKKEDEHDLVLTWKGHNVVFATAWVPA